MIVISGALVLVALILLVIGIVGPELAFVYASIAVSLVSLVFLVIGILQRRGETLPGEATAPAPAAEVTDPTDGATAVLATPARRAEPTVAEPQDENEYDEDDGLERGGTVLVVAGRPRYHVDGCRYLVGKDDEALDVLDAREEGFTPCGVCKPDATLAALQDQDELDDEELPAPAALEDEAELEHEVVEEPVPVVAARSGRGRTATVPVDPVSPVVDEAPVTSRRTAAKAATRAATTAAVVDAPPARAAKAPAAPRPAKAVPVSKGTPVTKAARTAPVVSTPIATPPAAPVQAPPVTAAPVKSARAGSVVVIPDRGRFHRAQCRYVRGVAGATTLSKSAATKQGYDACGVCKP